MTSSDRFFGVVLRRCVRNVSPIDTLFLGLLLFGPSTRMIFQCLIKISVLRSPPYVNRSYAVSLSGCGFPPPLRVPSTLIPEIFPFRQRERPPLPTLIHASPHNQKT